LNTFLDRECLGPVEYAIGLNWIEGKGRPLIYNYIIAIPDSIILCRGRKGSFDSAYFIDK